MLCAGQLFEGYVVNDVLGHGGSATVYRAHAEDDARHAVALKVLADDRCGPAERRRLQREFDFAQRVHHPHVITMDRRGDGWLAMQLVDGGTVTTLDQLHDRLTAVVQVAGAVDHVHHCGIVHCDVKPSNILVHRDFPAKGAVLTDFGVAYAVVEDYRTRPQPLLASLPYLAPEMLQGRPPSAATDEYALACTAVELVTGTTPFTAESADELAEAHLSSPPPHLSRRFEWLPRPFDGVIGKAMAKDPEVRYPTCTEFASAVTRVLRG